MGFAIHTAAADPAEAVAQIAEARRDRMLRVNRRRLRWEDLEDCYSQATLELVARSRRSPFASLDHLENALEQKFASRIEDRRRAIGGRSSIEAAMARAVSVDSPEYGAGDLEDRRAAVEQQAISRTELGRLRELIADLSRDQQLVLVSQVCVDMGTSEFCSRYGWSVEKYRKVAQRARAKLRVLVEEYERGDRCRRLEPDVLALSARVAEGQALTRAKVHLANCQSCARLAGDIDRASRSTATVVPLPAALAAGVWLRLGGIWSGLRRGFAIARHPLAETSYGGVGAAGGSMASLGALKVGIAVVCVAGAAGGYAVCSHLGVVPQLGSTRHRHHAATGHTTAYSRRPDSRARSGRARTEPAETSATRSPTEDAHLSQVSKPRPITAIEQIRREFGARRARSASSTRTVATTPTAKVAAPSPPAMASPPSRQARQTQAEFGFER